MKSIKEIIEDFQRQYAHYSNWFFKEPDGSWNQDKQEKHDKVCVDKHCFLKVYEKKRTKSIEEFYQDLRIQFKHASYWFVKGWSKRNQKKHSEKCMNKHCILTVHRKKTSRKEALENGKKVHL